MFTPAADQIGVYPLSFVVSDGSTVDYETVQIAVRARNPSGRSFVPFIFVGG
jgi:hypothetical protein